MVHPGQVVAEKAFSLVRKYVEEAILKVHILNVANSVLCVQVDLVLGVEVDEQSV